MTQSQATIRTQRDGDPAESPSERDLWSGSAANRETTLHQLSPYIGKMKSSMAAALVLEHTRDRDAVYDPFCGSGTILLEAWSAGRHVIGTDLSPYAIALSRGKIHPPTSENEVLADIRALVPDAKKRASLVDLRRTPKWVRTFFHPETLREIIAWSTLLREGQHHFLLACLLGILHHQRPGFLSYPSSHSVPYLRHRKYPREEFPQLYEYRPLLERLVSKVQRSVRRMPLLDHRLKRACEIEDAASYTPNNPISAIITSPPYMSQLDYARDNRLRLWVLGVDNWEALDHDVSPGEQQFLELMRACFAHWLSFLRRDGKCVLVIGDASCRSYGLSLADTMVALATDEVGGYSLVSRYTDTIPDDRRVRRNCRGNLSETVIVLANSRGGRR